MAVLHYCYRFELTALDELLSGTRQAVAQRLLDAATTAIASPSAVLQEALPAIRYDPTWLVDSSEQWNLEAKRLVLCLLSSAAPNPALGRPPEPPYHVILSTLLADAGWSEKAISLLIHGEPLSTLKALHADAPLPWAAGLSDFGGWLGHDQNQRLLAALRASAGYFCHEPTRHKARLGEIVPQWSLDAPRLAHAAWARAVEMLNGAASPEQALFLLLD